MNMMMHQPKRIQSTLTQVKNPPVDINGSLTENLNSSDKYSGSWGSYVALRSYKILLEFYNFTVLLAAVVVLVAVVVANKDGS